MRATFAALLVLASISLVAPGCADTDDELRAVLRDQRDLAVTTVSRTDIARQPAGSPARAALELWRAVQFRNAQAGIAAVAPAPPARLLPSFEKFFVETGANGFTSLKPRVGDTVVAGRRASLRLDIVRIKRLGKLVEEEVTPARFEFVRSGGRWKLLWRPALTELRKAGV